MINPRVDDSPVCRIVEQPLSSCDHLFEKVQGISGTTQAPQGRSPLPFPHAGRTLKDLDLGECLARRRASGNRSTEDFPPALKAGNNNELYQEATNGKWDTENGDGRGLILTLNFDGRD